MRRCPWILALFLAQIGTLDAARHHRDLPLTCECSTSQCLQQGKSLCTTREGLCFAQYLERGPSTPPFVRGCTDGRTPLLCENRRPSHVKNWPLLRCCDTDLCNGAELVPTPTAIGSENLKKLDLMGNNESEDRPGEPSTESSASSPLSSVQKSPWPRIVSPVYLSVLVLGIVSLVIIGIVAATVLRRNNADYYGALEFQPGKTCDSELDSIGSSYLHITGPNSVDT